MIIEHQGKKPVIHPTAYIAPNAVISGDVTIGAHTRILFGAVITAEGAPIEIGENVVIMENAVIRASGGQSRKFATMIGDYVLVGPHSYICGATLLYRAFIGTGSVIYNGAIIGRNASVSVGSIVHIQTRIPDETVVPLKHIVIGNPCKLFASNQSDEILDELMRRNFREYVFNLEEKDILAARYSHALLPHMMDRMLSAEETPTTAETADNDPVDNAKTSKAPAKAAPKAAATNGEKKPAQKAAAKAPAQAAKSTAKSSNKTKSARTKKGAASGKK